VLVLRAHEAGDPVGDGVAVAGWQWCQSIFDVNAVILIPVGMWQCKNWLSCGGWEKCV
jgi:hypothetical protein